MGKKGKDVFDKKTKGGLKKHADFDNQKEGRKFKVLGRKEHRAKNAINRPEVRSLHH